MRNILSSLLYALLSPWLLLMLLLLLLPPLLLPLLLLLLSLLIAPSLLSRTLLSPSSPAFPLSSSDLLLAAFTVPRRYHYPLHSLRVFTQRAVCTIDRDRWDTTQARIKRNANHAPILSLPCDCS